MGVGRTNSCVVGDTIVNYHNYRSGEIVTSESQIAMEPIAAKRYFAAATDGNGSVLFSGGDVSVIVDKYTKDGKHSAFANFSEARAFVAAATDGNGNVLFGGGQMGSGAKSALVDKYAKDGAHSMLEPLSVARSQLLAATDGNGNVLFGGGYNSSVVDKYTKDGVHSVIEPLSAARYNHAVATDGNGNVLFGGGVDNANNDSALVDKYTKDGIRSMLEPLSVARGRLDAAMDGNGDVLFGGGVDKADTNYAVVDKYTKDGVHSVIEPLSVARYEARAATDYNGNVLFVCGMYRYIGGGYLRTKETTSVDKYTKDGVHSLREPFPVTVDSTGLKAATDGNGNVLFGGVANGEVKNYPITQKFVSTRSDITLYAPVGSKLKEEAGVEQVFNTEQITVKTPFNGYIKYKKGDINYV